MWDLGHAGVRVPPLYFSPSVSLCEVSIKGSSSGGDTGLSLPQVKTHIQSLAALLP